MTAALDRASDAMKPTRTPKQKRKAFLGAIAGHLIEWYDYGVYGFVAVYVGAAFFAASTPAIALLSSFATFALSFFMRPLGGLVFGPLADRIGRKNTMALIMFLMSGSTFMIGLLPTYETIGILAPALLILARMLQGLSAGGEVGTVASYIAEYGGQKRRGMVTSLLLAISVAGLLLGSIVANGLAALLGDEAMYAWGWRLPFLVAGPLGFIAAFIRSRLEDSAEFEAISEAGETEKRPIRASLAWFPTLTLVAGCIALLAAMFYFVLTFASTFFVNNLGFDNTTRFWFIVAAGVTSAALMPLGGLITDVFGRRWFLVVTAALHIPALYWFFTTAASENVTPGRIFLPFMTCAVLFGLYSSTPYAVMTDLIPTHIRATGVSLAYNIPVAVFGGSAPFIASALVSYTGNLASPMYFFIGVAIFSFISVLIINEKHYQKAARANAELNDRVAVSQAARTSRAEEVEAAAAEAARSEEPKATPTA